MNKEKQSSMYPAETISMSFRFSGKALQWLHGTTKDDGGKETGNFTLFPDFITFLRHYIAHIGNQHVM